MNDQTVTPLAAASVIASAEARDDGLHLALDESWLQGRSWYGGIQIGLAMRAARALAGEAPLRSLHATFVGPIFPDRPAVARAELLRAGRSVTQVRAWIDQGDGRCLESTAVFGHSRKSSVNHDSDRPSDADPEKAYRIPFRRGITPNCIQHYDMRWARGRPPFSGAADPAATILARPAADAPFTEAEFLALTDVIPPPVISIMKAPTPVSSMNCALELIRPEIVYGSRQWIRFEVELHDTHSGYAWQTAHLYDEAGSLLAISHQSVAVFG